MNKDSSQESCIVCGGATKVLLEALVDDRYGCPGKFAIERCSTCGHAVTVPRLQESDLPSLYQKYYPRKDVDLPAIEAEVKRNAESFAAIKRWFSGTDNQGQFFAKPGQDVLDVGCGSCQSLLELKRSGACAYGVEADPNVKSIAEHFGLNVHIGSIWDEPFPGVSFDFVVMNQVIEHIPDPEKSLALVANRLKPGGQVVLSFPNAGSIYRKMSGRHWINWHVPYHQHHFTRRSIEMMAETLGLRIVRARTITPNLWTVLQYRNWRAGAAEGRPSAVWGAGTPAPAKVSFRRKVINKSLRILLRALNPGIALVNRLIDAAGFGDSLLVVLSRR
jgi:2-polyprenyl-3-methyl-5-hydroxy-6-metoxy-1,4-benzoquinol methylase